MKENVRHGTWFIRQLIRLFTVILAVLFFWLLGFVVEDIETIPGPTYAEIEHKFVDAKLVRQDEQLQKQIADLEQSIAAQAQQQQIVRDSSENLQRTIQQLLQLKKSSVEKSVSFSDSDAKLLTASLNEFFAGQKSYQKINQTISDLTSQTGRLANERSRVEAEIAKQRKSAQREYDSQTEAHRLRLAFYQLLILVPLLLATAYPLVKRRGSLYYPLFLAIGGATLLKVTLVVHEYFPSRYFKYILILVHLLVVARLLIHLIRTVAFSKAAWLKRQYREAYERFLCPICEYPIRTTRASSSTGRDAPSTRFCRKAIPPRRRSLHVSSLRGGGVQGVQAESEKVQAFVARPLRALWGEQGNNKRPADVPSPRERGLG